MKPCVFNIFKIYLKACCLVVLKSFKYVVFILKNHFKLVYKSIFLVYELLDIIVFKRIDFWPLYIYVHNKLYF